MITDKGQFIKGKFGSDFKFSLSTVNNDLFLPAGGYIVMIDPVWNETAANDANFKQVMLDIYSKQHLEITPLPDAYGFDKLTRAVKNAAVSRTPKETQTPLHPEPKHPKTLRDNTPAP